MSNDWAPYLDDKRRTKKFTQCEYLQIEVLHTSLYIMKNGQPNIDTDDALGLQVNAMLSPPESTGNGSDWMSYYKQSGENEEYSATKNVLTPPISEHFPHSHRLRNMAAIYGVPV